MRLLLPLLLATFSPAAAADESSAANELSKTERLALENAVDEEHRAIATYAKVLLDLGAPKPFAEVLAAHKAQTATLKSLLEQHGEAMPASRWAGRVHAPPTVLAACTEALHTERESIARHAAAREATEREPLRAAYAAWEATVREEHIPAFEKCVEKEEKQAEKRERKAD